MEKSIYKVMSCIHKSIETIINFVTVIFLVLNKFSDSDCLHKLYLPSTTAAAHISEFMSG